MPSPAASSVQPSHFLTHSHLLTSPVLPVPAEEPRTDHSNTPVTGLCPPVFTDANDVVALALSQGFWLLSLAPCVLQALV